MAKTIEQIQKEVQQIKNETVAKQNTATRVGGALEDMVEKMEDMVEKMEADSISVEGKLTNLGIGLEDVQILCDSIKTEFGAEKRSDGEEIPLPPIQDGYITIGGTRAGGLNHYSINVASYPIGKRLSVKVGSQQFTTNNTSVLGVNKGGVGGTDFKLVVGSIAATQVIVDEIIEIDGSFDTILISVRSSSIPVKIVDLKESYTFSKIEDIKEAKESADKALQAISSDKKKETPIVLPGIETGYYRDNGSFVSGTYFHYSIPIDKNGNDSIRLIGRDGSAFSSNTTAVIHVRNNGNFVRTILISTVYVKSEFDEIVDIDGTFDEVIVCFRSPSFFEAFYFSALDRISALEGDLMGIEQRVEKLEEGFTSKKYKILVVGNSFSIRGITVANASLLDLCKKAGIRCYAEVIGNSGARLSTNYSKYVADTACEYHLYGDESTGWSSHNGDGFTIKEAFEKEDWDYIVFHQGSADSGTESTYEPYLKDFIREAKLHCPNEYVRIGLQLTWAYANLTGIYPISPSTSPYTSTAFATQMEFYEAIVNCYKSESKEHNINYVIPSGTAIQNARGTKLGTEHNDFAASTDDAVHINAYGSVLTALAWFAILIGRDNNISIKDIPKFSTLYDDDDYELVKKCVTNAVKLPYIVNVPL